MKEKDRCYFKFVYLGDGLRWVAIALFVLALVMLFGCSTTPSPWHDRVYKYNPHERKYELTSPSSRLVYNVHSRKWEYAK